MNGVIDRLRSAPIFEGLDDGTLCAIAEEVAIRAVPAGTTLFSEGDEAGEAFVVVTGEIEVTVFAPPHRVTVGTCAPGDVLGEISLIRGRRRNATATALTDAELAVIEAPLLEELGSRAAGGRDLIRTVLRRLEETEARVEQARRMSQLGTLTAGVAHELNNPAAAVRRTGASLDDAVTRMVEAATEILPDDTRARIRQVATEPPPPLVVGGLGRLDRAAELSRHLVDAGVARADDRGEELASIGVDDEALATLLAMPLDIRGVAVDLVVAAWSARRMATEVEQAAERITEITETLASYSRLGRAPHDSVDVTAGIEQSITLLGERLGRIEVRRQYAPDLPPIDAVASELNQVWTNLLANAADATGPGGVLTVRTRLEDGDVVVDVIDDGPGIDDEVLPRIFDDFYTTKPPGAGTGLGLAISRRIVVGGHGGRIDVDSRPGRTVFSVRLPTMGDSGG